MFWSVIAIKFINSSQSITIIVYKSEFTIQEIQSEHEQMIIIWGKIYCRWLGCVEQSLIMSCYSTMQRRQSLLLQSGGKRGLGLAMAGLLLSSLTLYTLLLSIEFIIFTITCLFLSYKQDHISQSMAQPWWLMHS